MLDSTRGHSHSAYLCYSVTTGKTMCANHNPNVPKFNLFWSIILFSKFDENLSITFWVIQFTNRQTRISILPMPTCGRGNAAISHSSSTDLTDTLSLLTLITVLYLIYLKSNYPGFVFVHNRCMQNKCLSFLMIYDLWNSYAPVVW